MLHRLLHNHVLANLVFVLVLVLGASAYSLMPRAQDPEINFNFVSIATVLPGATAADVESLVTSPLEDALRNVRDIKFVTSTSRENSSVILIRFRELSERDFDKRVADLRREIQSKANDELPDDIEDPDILEFKAHHGIPGPLMSCHTAVIDGYFVEGHVPANDILRLLKEKPAHVTGIAVPGMPLGSPGMEHPRPQDFNTIALLSDGSAYVFEAHAAGEDFSAE